MESRVGPEPTSLALRPRIQNALQKAFIAQKNKASQEAPPENQETAPESQQKREEVAVATQFHRFLDLPTELRLEIWEAAARHKRYVILDPPCNSLAICIRLLLRQWIHDDPEYPGDRVPMWTSRRTPPPALLSVSREAREVALKKWQPAFACDVFPAKLYMNFDQDDVVIGAGARVNDYFGLGLWHGCLQPWRRWVAAMMLGAWRNTPDVEKIQRLVACGNFMKDMDDVVTRQDFMTGLKSLTMVRIGNLKEPCDCGHFRCSPNSRRIYTRTRGSGKGTPLLSLGGIDFVKTADACRCARTRSFAELELIDFVGGKAWAEVQTSWVLGPEAYAWGPTVDGLPTAVHLGPGRRCVWRSKRRYETTKTTNIWYSI